jgi:hypothetical protein
VEGQWNVFACVLLLSVLKTSLKENLRIPLRLYSLVYAARPLPADTLSVPDAYAGSLPIVLRHPLNSGIELAVFVTKKWS